MTSSINFYREQPSTFGSNQVLLGDQNIPQSQFHQQQVFCHPEQFTGFNIAASDLESEAAFEDLKLLDFPIYDETFDETSLEDMFSQSSPSPFDPNTPETPTPTTTYSSYSPSPSLSMTSNRTSVTVGSGGERDLILTSNASGPGMSAGTPSPTGSAILPSFLETYSPRYRTSLGLVGPTVNPPTNAMPDPSVIAAAADAFFKFEDLVEDDSLSPGQLTLSSEPMVEDSQVTSNSTPAITGLAFVKQEVVDTLDQVCAPANSNIQDGTQTFSSLFNEGFASMSPSALRTIKREPRSRRSSRVSTHSFGSPSATSGRSSVSSMGSVDHVRTFSPGASSGASISNTISPPLTPMTPPRTRGALQRKSSFLSSPAETSGSLSGASFQQKSPILNMGHKVGYQNQSSSGTSSTASSRSSASMGNETNTLAPGTCYCAVCGDTAACQHYGVRTCEGCKGFFKRTVQKGAKYVCLGNKDCVVDKRRRNRCQFCRFQKCLSVGMVKEVVRTDDLKGRRGRLPSKPKSPQESPPSPPISTITALVRSHLDTNPDIANLDSHLMCPVSHESVTNDSVHQFYRIFNASLDTIKMFAEKIPGFSDLTKSDQEMLHQASVLELFSLRFAYRNVFDSERMIFCNGVVLHRSQVELLFGSKWFNSIRRLSQQIHDMGLDISALACLCALTLISGKLISFHQSLQRLPAERPGLAQATKVEQLQTKVIDSLRDHCTYNSEAQKKIWYFSKILSVLPELRSISSEGFERMQQLNKIILMPESLRTLFENASTSS